MPDFRLLDPVETDPVQENVPSFPTAVSSPVMQPHDKVVPVCERWQPRDAKHVFNRHIIVRVRDYFLREGFSIEAILWTAMSKAQE